LVDVVAELDFPLLEEELLSNVVDEVCWLGGGLVGFDAVDELNSANDVG